MSNSGHSTSRSEFIHLLQDADISDSGSEYDSEMDDLDLVEDLEEQHSSRRINDEDVLLENIPVEVILKDEEQANELLNSESIPVLLMETDGEIQRTAVFYPNVRETAKTANITQTSDNRRINAVSQRGRGYLQSRGARLRGGNRGRGRNIQTKSGTVDGGLQREGIIEVYLHDEDVPQRLREMVLELDARRAKRERDKRRDDQVLDEEDEKFYDAEENCIATELFDGEKSALRFQWSPMASFKGSRCDFQPGRNIGPRDKPICCYDAFRQFWGDDILEHIVRETNQYALELKKSSLRVTQMWYDTNVHEILILFSFWMMLGIIRMPSIASCFSINPLLKTDIFRTMMTNSRYWILNRALNFVDKSTCNEDSSELIHFGPIPDYLNKKFMEAYTPDQDIVIEETLTSWKGKLGFRHYIKTKAAQFGIKTYELCESATGYLWSFKIHLGKDLNDTSSLPERMKTVVELIRPLLNKGYRLFVDNWFSSPLLARFLKRNNTDCVGILEKSCKNVPSLLQIPSPQGTCIARHCGDMAVMAYHGKKIVHTISTHHGTESICLADRSNSTAYKPTVVAEYNANMGGVDRKDQMLEPYLLERKRCKKWYKKVFKRLLNVSIFNSQILLEKSSTKSQAQSLAFRLDLVEQIMQKHLEHVPKPHIPSTHRSSDLPYSRFSGKHFIVRSEVDDNKTVGPNRNSKNRRHCLWCTVREKRHSRTVWICDRCEVPLCLQECFKKFHTLK